MDMSSILAPWGLLIVCYLFLGGAAGGAFCVAAIAEFRSKYKALAKWAGFISAPAIIVGLLFLIADIGRPERAFLVFTNVGSSIMTWGSIIIAVFSLLAVVYISFWAGFFPWSSWTKGRRLTAALGLPFALATMFYTGLLIGAAPGRPLWSFPLIPVVFAVGGLSAGIALSIAVPVVMYRLLGKKNQDEALETYHAIEEIHGVDRYIVVVELILLGSLLYAVGALSYTGGGVVWSLVLGPMSWMFWGVLILVGFAAPIAIYSYIWLSRRHHQDVGLWPALLSAFAILVGAITLRYLILAAGYSTPIPFDQSFFQTSLPVYAPTAKEYGFATLLFFVLGAVYYVEARLFVGRTAHLPTSRSA
jgi:formate-dependent nitrite reductase membrane component NrfD